MSSIEIREIPLNKKEIKKFIKFAWEIYKDYPNWIPPLIIDKLEIILDGPYKEIGVIQPYGAYRDGKMAGRIIAHYDTRHNEYFNEKRGCVGFFECINDKEVSRALFRKSEEWLKEQGMETMDGPFSFMVYDESGLLADAYDMDPVIENPYTPPYYIELFEDYGFKKTRDWYAYLFKADQEIPGLYHKIRDKHMKGNSDYTFRNLNPKKFWEDIHMIKDVFNVAWDKNWGHYPMTDRQVETIANNLKMVYKPELMILAMKDDKLAGFSVSLPDANQAIKKANGRLFPFGIIKILLGMRKVKRLKTLMLGVLEEHRMRGLEVVFILETIDRGKKMGYVEADCSLIVEDNVDMNNALEHLGARRYKTYRFFSRAIS